MKELGSACGSEARGKGESNGSNKRRAGEANSGWQGCEAQGQASIYISIPRVGSTGYQVDETTKWGGHGSSGYVREQGG